MTVKNKMTVKVYLSQSLIDSKNKPRIVDGKFLMEGYKAIPLNFDATLGQYLEINWPLSGYQEEFKLVPGIENHVAMITLFQDVYLDACYVTGKYKSGDLGGLRIVRSDRYSGKVFIQADSFNNFIELIRSYKEGNLVLENTDKTSFQILLQKNEELSKKLEIIESSLFYKLWFLPQTIKNFMTRILNRVGVATYTGHDM